MQHDAFIGQVQARARLDSRGAAEQATRASLETLAERIPAAVAEKAAAQLPQEIGEHLRRVAYSPNESIAGERMSPPEFFERVAMRAHCTYPKAQYEARCVIEVADEATEGALARQIRPAIDDELASILFAGSSG